MVIYESACNMDRELNAKVKVETSSQDGMYLWVTRNGNTIFPGAGWILFPSATSTQSVTVYISEYGYGLYQFFLTSQPFSSFSQMKLLTANGNNGCYKDWDDSKVFYQFGLCKNLTEGTNCGCDGDHCAIIQ